MLEQNHTQQSSHDSPFLTVPPGSGSPSGQPAPVFGEAAGQKQTLRGNLETFPFQDLLMLVSQQHRTGVLHLTPADEADSVDLTFRCGMLIKAKKARPKARELFGNLLVEARLITDQQRTRAVDEQRRTLKQLGEILVDMGALSRESLRDFVHLQTMESVYLPFEWGNTGKWEFTEVELGDDFQGVLPIDCGVIVREGLARRSAWPALRRRFKTHVVTFRRVKPFPPPGSPALIKAQKRGHILGARERRIFALAEPDVSLGTIISLSRIGEFETLSALDDLYDAGLIRLGPIQGTAATESGLITRLRNNKKAVAFAALVAALVGLAVWRGVRDADSTGEIPQKDSMTLHEIIGDAQRSRIAAAIEIYRIREGKLPASLSILVTDGLLTRKDLSYPFRKSFIYRPQEDGTYLLLAPLE